VSWLKYACDDLKLGNSIRVSWHASTFMRVCKFDTQIKTHKWINNKYNTSMGDLVNPHAMAIWPFCKLFVAVMCLLGGFSLQNHTKHSHVTYDLILAYCRNEAIKCNVSIKINSKIWQNVPSFRSIYRTKITNCLFYHR
jgi:hypothetical protein